MAAKAKKGAKGGGDDESEDEYTALSKSVFNMGNRSSGVKPPVGSFEKCAKCEKQFTVVRDTFSYENFRLLIQLTDTIYNCSQPTSWLAVPYMCKSVWFGPF